MSRAAITAKPLLNGSYLPDFSLTGLKKQISIADLMGDNGVVIAFIHGTWCPYCIQQLIRLNKAVLKLNKLGIGAGCITHDPVSTIASYQQTAKPPLRYPLIADSDPSISHQYGVYDEEHGSPYVAVFLADKERKIIYTDVSSDPDCFPNMQRLIEMAEKL